VAAFASYRFLRIEAGNDQEEAEEAAI